MWSGVNYCVLRSFGEECLASMHYHPLAMRVCQVPMVSAKPNWSTYTMHVRFRPSRCKKIKITSRSCMNGFWCRRQHPLQQRNDTMIHLILYGDANNSFAAIADAWNAIQLAMSQSAQKHRRRVYKPTKQKNEEKKRK